MKVADFIFLKLSTITDVVFFVPGGGAMYLVDALGRSGLRHVSAIHEAGAGTMALGYAMAAGRLGVCLVTSGPGCTNAITPCLAAWMDSVPVLFISGQAKSTTLIGISGLRSVGVQECDIIPMVKPITKYCAQPMIAEYYIQTLEHMIDECLSGRKGPCWLSIPQDIQNEET